MKTVNLPMTSNKLEFLQKSGIPHTAYFTNNSTHIKLINEPLAYFMAPSFMKRKDLNFVQKVKRAAKNSGLPDQRISPAHISYFQFNQIQDSTNIVEVDVNHAYWHIAKHLGIIPEDVFKQGETVEKMTRLISLGSLASKKKVFQFDGKNYHWIGYKYDPVLRSYFFKVSYELDIIMREIFSKIEDAAYFYWFDAFFVSPQVADTIAKELEAYGLNSKKQPIREIAKMQDPATGFEFVKVADKDKHGKKRVRTFYLPGEQRFLELVKKYET